MEVKEKRTLSVKMHCKTCQEVVAERLRFEWRWYSLVAFVLSSLFLGIYAVPTIVAGAPFLLIHVHRCSKCDTELLRGSYLSILRQRRKLDTLGLTFPFYSGPVLFMMAIVLSDLRAPPTWEYYKAVCGEMAIRGNFATAEAEFAQHFYKEKVTWSGWYLGPSSNLTLPSSPSCHQVMMDFRTASDPQPDLYLCESPLLPPQLPHNLTVGQDIVFTATLESLKGPMLYLDSAELVGTGVFERFGYNETQGGGGGADGFLMGNQ